MESLLLIGLLALDVAGSIHGDLSVDAGSAIALIIAIVAFVLIFMARRSVR